MPGLLATVGLLEAAPLWTDLYHYAWFLSFGTAFLAYAGLMLRTEAGGNHPVGATHLNGERLCR